jgi:hypothetical protein
VLHQYYVYVTRLLSNLNKILFYLSFFGDVALSKKKFGLMNNVCVQSLADFWANHSRPFSHKTNTDFPSCESDWR